MTTIRDHLQAIYDRHGKLTPELVLDECRKPDHPLHKHIFNQDLKTAAWEWYRYKAQELITSVKIVYRESDDKDLTVRAFHAIRREDGYTYEPVDNVVKDPFLSKLLMQDMEREWKQLRKRYENFREFWKIVTADAESTTLAAD